MLPPSAISVAALQLREHLSPADLAAKILPMDQILIGHPKSAVDTIASSNVLHHINLFLYHLFRRLDLLQKGSLILLILRGELHLMKKAQEN